jgi:hypothetical protein
MSADLKYEDVLNSQDVIDRMEELLEEINELWENSEEADPEVLEEFKELEGFAKYASEVDDWEHECYFIRDSNFTDYTRELAEDCYEISSEWPFRCIDWQQASEELKCDYSAYDFGGVTYWIAA